MTLPEDRPSTSERYGLALQSSHLELTVKPGDVDLLIASGWARESLGCQLFRLRIEFDSINHLELARADALTAKLMTMNKLTMFHPAVTAMDKFAQDAATRASLKAEPRAVYMTAVFALDAWLVPNCYHCGGRGFNGGFDVPRIMCTHCGGTGKRQVRLGKVEVMHQFGRKLLTHMDSKCDLVAKRMREFLSQRESAKKIRRDAAQQALAQRLADLRSTAAQED